MFSVTATSGRSEKLEPWLSQRPGTKISSNPSRPRYLREGFISVLEGLVLRLPTRQGGAVLVGAGVGIVVDRLGSPWWKTALIATFVASSLIAVIRGNWVR